MDKFSERFKYFRDKLELTQRGLAEKLEIPSTAISKYEQELIRPSADLLTKIGLMGININWLLTGEGEMMNSPPAPPGNDVMEARDDTTRKAVEVVSGDPRIAAIAGLLADMTKEEIDEVYKYISKEKRLGELERAVEELRAAQAG
jgi:transcriptional regulator with XRE-family HTH domain